MEKFARFILGAHKFARFLVTQMRLFPPRILFYDQNTFYMFQISFELLILHCSIRYDYLDLNLQTNVCAVAKNRVSSSIRSNPHSFHWQMFGSIFTLIVPPESDKLAHSGHLRLAYPPASQKTRWFFLTTGRAGSVKFSPGRNNAYGVAQLDENCNGTLNSRHLLIKMPCEKQKNCFITLTSAP